MSDADISPLPGRCPAQLGSHLKTSTRIRHLFTKLADHEIDELLGALMSDDMQRVIRWTVRFNWHGELIRALWRHPGVKSILLHTLLR